MSAKKNIFYFPHDTNARSDEKILAVRMRHHAEGYGIYFMIIEMLAEQPEHTLSRDYDMIAFELRADSNTVRSVIEDFGLFQVDNDRFCSLSLIERMEPIDNLRQQRSAAGRKSAERRALVNKVSSLLNDTATDNSCLLDNDATVVEQNGNIREKREESIGEKGEKGEKGEESVAHARESDTQPSSEYHEIILSGIVDFYEKNIHATYIPDFRVETTAAHELAEKIKIAMKGENWIPTADSVRTFWLDFLSAAYQVADTWQRNHFDIRTLNSQFNNFYLKIKNGNQPDNGSANNGTSRDTLERKIREAAGIV